MRAAAAAVGALLVLTLAVNEASERSASSGEGGACAVCACTGDTVQCSGGTLRGLPLPLPAHAKHLTLEDVDLSEESSGNGACGDWGTGLASLWARACGVRELRACWLAGAAQSLHALDLARNLLERLEEGALPGLPALHTLSLRRNRIHYIGAGALGVAPALRVLRLDGNRLRALSGQLAVLTTLREAWLGEQPLERVGGAGWAGGGAALQLLELRGAGLQRLELDALHHLPALRTLVLAGSGWAAHAPLAVHSRRLDSLRLDSCRLTRLPAPPCRLHPTLRTLYLYAAPYTPRHAMPAQASLPAYPLTAYRALVYFSFFTLLRRKL